jgi:hypothetical protein
MLWRHLPEFCSGFDDPLPQVVPVDFSADPATETAHLTRNPSAPREGEAPRREDSPKEGQEGGVAFP